jgi:diguanylate cyclase (GGDEF)-like protein
MARKFSHAAEHDFLTDLPNRLLLTDRIDRAIAAAQSSQRQVAVLFLDLDGFKHINDSLGHGIGDRLLKAIAKRLLSCARGADTVSRQGGDEFVILLPEIARTEDAALMAARVIKAVAETHAVEPHNLYITTSIGISVFPDDGLDAESLIKNADLAMYEAKENGRNRFRFFKSSMNMAAVERQSIERDLRHALQREEFSLVYQPKINIDSERVVGVEALLRWTHPTRGPISPTLFIPIAEACGLILPIGAWVMKTVCHQAHSWAEVCLDPIPVAVNVSAIEFSDAAFMENLVGILKTSNLKPALLELELTESALMTRVEQAARLLQTIRDAGVRIAVDDFGTGYSSLSYLQDLPLDTIKIDRCFVQQISGNRHQGAIVTAIISMARSLQLNVVAEGVETDAELAFLKQHNCDEAQGWYFGKPVAARQLPALISQFRGNVSKPAGVLRDGSLASN